MIKEVLFDLGIITNKTQSLKAISKYKVNYYLLKNVLFAEAYGIVTY